MPFHAAVEKALNPSPESINPVFPDPTTIEFGLTDVKDGIVAPPTRKLIVPVAPDTVIGKVPANVNEEDGTVAWSCEGDI
jgi:hypothetical protein